MAWIHCPCFLFTETSHSLLMFQRRTATDVLVLGCLYWLIIHVKKVGCQIYMRVGLSQHSLSQILESHLKKCSHFLATGAFFETCLSPYPLSNPPLFFFLGFKANK